MGVKGNTVFLQEGDLKICLPFCMQRQKGRNSWFSPRLGVGYKKGEKHNVGDSIHQGSGVHFGIKSFLKPI